MYILKVPFQVILALEHTRAQVTLEGFDVTNIMYSGQVRFQCAFMCKLPVANVTLECCDITHAMNGSQMNIEVAFLCKLPAADITLVPGVRMFRSAAVLSMRRVVVSADR